MMITVGGEGYVQLARRCICVHTYHVCVACMAATGL